MANLRLKISRKKEDWAAIEEAIQKKSGGRDLDQKGKSINGYLASEIHKRYSKRPLANCIDVVVIKTFKNFEVEVSDDIMAKIVCEARTEGVPVTTLISRIVFDPLSGTPTDLPL